MEGMGLSAGSWDALDEMKIKVSVLKASLPLTEALPRKLHSICGYIFYSAGEYY